MFCGYYWEDNSRFSVAILWSVVLKPLNLRQSFDCIFTLLATLQLPAIKILKVKYDEWLAWLVSVSLYKCFITYTLPIWRVVSNRHLFLFLLFLLLLCLLNEQHLFLGRNQQWVGVNSCELVRVGGWLARQNSGRSCRYEFLVLENFWEIVKLIMIIRALGFCNLHWACVGSLIDDSR